MKMSGPEEYRIPNTFPMIHAPAIPRAVTEVAYRVILLDMLTSIHALGNENDPAYGYTAFELEEMVSAAGLTLPIVRRAEHEQESE